MEKKIYDESNGLWYELQGDYYIPCLSLPEEETQLIGVWGQRHRRFLREHRKKAYYTMLTGGRLNSYLAEVDRQAENMFFRLVEKCAASEDVTEVLKAVAPMEWVGRMNNIRSRVTEVVNSEIIYAMGSLTKHLSTYKNIGGGSLSAASNFFQNLLDKPH